MTKKANFLVFILIGCCLIVYGLIPQAGVAAGLQDNVPDLPPQAQGPGVHNNNGHGSQAHLHRGTLHPDRDFHAPGLHGDALPQKGHILVQFENLPSEAELQALETAGVTVLRYIPDNTYIVSVRKEAASFSHAATGLAGGIRRWREPAPEHKISLAIDNDEFPPWARYDNGRVGLLVLFFDDVLTEEAIELITALNPAIEIIRWEMEQVLLVKTPRGLISHIAALDAVEWVEPPQGPNIPVNLVAAERINADVLRTAPLSLLGSGVTVGIWDGGAVFDHNDFDDRLTVVDTGAAAQWHATHVAGTVGGSGLGNLNATGMAPNVFLHSYDWDSDVDEMRAAAIALDGIDLSNHSYGYGFGWQWNGSLWVDAGNTSWFGYYSTYTAEWDDVVYDTDLIVFKSVGNDRGDGPGDGPLDVRGGCPGGTDCDGPYDCVPTRGVAKNIISVGATTDADGMASFSSWGPTDDGRIKPDLCANGTSLLSTNLNNQYVSASGTSMSSPGAAGAGALLFELFEQVNGAPPSAATMKALLIHGAQDLGRTGPDYEFGWGLIDAETSAALITRNAWRAGTVKRREPYSTEFEVSAQAQALKATLVWTDPEASAWTTLSLVNDLDLVLRDPADDVHYPWILEKDNPTAVAATGPNSIDTVEQVVVTSPLPGTWTLEISGSSLPMGGQQDCTVVVKELGDPCGPDLDGDGDIDGSDLRLLAADYGTGPCPCEGDVDCDLAVDMTDLSLFADDFGMVISTP